VHATVTKPRFRPTSPRHKGTVLIERMQNPGRSGAVRENLIIVGVPEAGIAMAEGVLELVVQSLTARRVPGRIITDMTESHRMPRCQFYIDATVNLQPVVRGRGKKGLGGCEAVNLTDQM
jgi:hypothetical protein